MRQPKYRRSLSEAQINQLVVIYIFRFVSVVGLARLKPRYPSVIYSRLKILHDQGYIAKNYDKSYRLKGKPASYYLLPKGLKLLKGRRGIDNQLLIYMRRDHRITPRFIDHHLAVLDIYSKLRHLYFKDKAELILTKYELAPYAYFPTPRPDIYFYFKKAGQKLDFMLDYFEEATPWFVIKQRIAQYMDHIENGDWDDTETDYPLVLLVCETPHLKKHLIKHITSSLEQIWIEELHFALTTMEALTNSNDKTDLIWLPINDEVGRATSLGRLQRQ